MRFVMLGAGGRLARLLRPRWPGPADWMTRTDADIDNPQVLDAVLDGADVIFCFAGATHDSGIPMERNVTLARKTLDAAKKARVFLFSSAAVYGALAGQLSEDGPTAPLTAYAMSKCAMETMAAAHTSRSVSLRLGNVAGADAILGGWHPGFKLDQLADGTTPARSYIGPGRLAQVLHDLAHADALPPVLNVAAPGTIQMGHLLDAAALTWSPRPAVPQTIARVDLSTDGLAQFTTFDPSDSTAAGIVADWRRGHAA